MRLPGLLSCAVLIAGFAVWALDPGLFAKATGNLSDYTDHKSKIQTANSIALAHRSLSIDEAYRSIPHQRTPFRADLSVIPSDEASYLRDLFRLTDAGVVERVFLQSHLLTGDMRSPEDSNYDELLQRLGALATPANLLPVEHLIFEALEDQQHYFRAWGTSGNARYFSPRAALVQSSHKKLIAAYNELMRLYGSETSHNKQAFFDHLCALDFI